MPFTINGIGTHYYGRRNASTVHGACAQCHREAQLTSYDTTECICLVFIPIIPIRKYRIESECSSCRRHYRIPLAEFNAAVSGSVMPRREQVQRDPADPRRHEALIVELMGLRLNADAESAAREAAIAFPQDEVLNGLAGELALARGDVSSAEAWFRRAVAANPRSAPAQVGLGRALTLLDRKEEAIIALQAGIASEATPYAVHLLASNQMELEKWPDAHTTLQRLVGLEPAFATDKAFLRMMGECKTRLGYLLSDEERKASRRWWPFRRKTKARRPIALGKSWTATPSSVSTRGVVIAAICLAVAAAAITGGLGWWRQNHIPVWFDNPTSQPATIRVDGASFRVDGRPPLLRELAPGKHHIVAVQAGRPDDVIDIEIPRESFVDALLAPRFFVYSVAAAGIYRRADMVYAKRESDQRTEATLIAFERWIVQPDTDYIFRDAPASLSVSGGTQSERKSLFQIAGDVTFRDLAWARYAEGKQDEAMKALQKGVELSPCDDDMRGDLVTFVGFTASPAEAREQAKNWMSACADSVPAHRAWQNLERQNGGRARVIGEYQRRLASSPTAANHYLYGRLLHGPEAVSNFTEALRIDPKFTWARFALGYQMLEEERDAEAFELLMTTVKAKDAMDDAAVYLAMASVGAGRQGEANELLAKLTHIDRWAIWQGKWIVARSTRDWPAAKLLLREHEQESGMPVATAALRAHLACEMAEGSAEAIAELAKSEETAGAARVLEFEQAFLQRRYQDAVMAEQVGLRKEGPPTLYSLYALEAAILDRSPDIEERLSKLRLDLEKEGATALLLLLDGIEGRVAGDELLHRVYEEADLRMAPHAWFAMGVSASRRGDQRSARAYFQKAADRALDREFPYRVAVELAKGTG